MRFNLYINDLAFKVNALGKGVKIDDIVVSILLYTDDVVLIAESEADLQAMLDTLEHGVRIIYFRSMSPSPILYTSVIHQ